MLTRLSHPPVGSGTPADLIQATELGARIATRRRRCDGLDDDVIRREVIANYKEEFGADEWGEYELETLIGAVQRAVDDALAEPRW